MLHVLSGVFWAGATFVMASHVTPSVKAAGPEGVKFMQQLAGKSSLSTWLAVTGTLTVLSGIVMYLYNDWLASARTPPGLVLGIGAGLGILAYLHGLFAQRKAILKLQSLGKEIAAGGGPPSPEQTARLGILSGKIERNGVILAYTLAASVVLMGTFQYF
ncbi:MAG TPA: hypothetical protein VMN57_13415 [Anaerolineales bacterium]|nr:hypothetical protein [Anaerolineales bacterium]